MLHCQKLHRFNPAVIKLWLHRVALLMVATVSLVSAPAAPAWSSLANKPDDWYRSSEGRRIVDTVLSWQSPAGSWPKNKDTTAQPFTGDPKKLSGTFDNGATTGELRFLARAFRATNEARYQKAFLKGVDHILKAQYPTGGWPQFYPPSQQYHRHITFNDSAMVRLMEFLREVATSADYAFVEADRRQAAQASFDRGIQCILKCQITAQGRLTVWCAQHDEVDLRPRSGRTYELVSLSGAESVGILHLLMSLDQPSPEITRSIQAGAAWFEAAKLTGIRQTRINHNKVIFSDPNAPPLWARFYEIETRSEERRVGKEC
jgi:PelA/Pel-15E family pectate lyase